MALSALDDLSATPTRGQVAAVLGGATEVWASLETWLKASAGVDAFEWGSPGKKYGWGLRAKAGNRVMAYLIPQEGFFLVGFVLGDRAVEAARGAALSKAARDILATARRYGEGTGFRLPVACPADLNDVKAFVRIKAEH